MDNLESSLNEMGEYHNQIIHFIGNVKRTFTDIISKSIKQGQFTKFMTKEKKMVLINDANVLCIEVIKKDLPKFSNTKTEVQK